MIRNIQLHHSGKYVCMVQTTLDSQSTAVDIIVRGMFIKSRHISSGGISISQHQLLFKKSQDDSLRFWQLSVRSVQLCLDLFWRLSFLAMQFSRAGDREVLLFQENGVSCSLLGISGSWYRLAKIKRPGLFPLFGNNMKDHFQ